MTASKPARPARDFELEHFLPYRLSLLSNTVSQGISAAYRGVYGLSVTEWRVVAILGRYPGLTASEIMQRAAMDKVAVSRAVKKLLGKQLVERSAHREDRRRQPLLLTAEYGQPLFEAVVPRAMAYERSLLTGFSINELRQFEHMLERLQSAAEALNEQAG